MAEAIFGRTPDDMTDLSIMNGDVNGSASVALRSLKDVRTVVPDAGLPVIVV